jgi:hypothetical protein
LLDRVLGVFNFIFLVIVLIYNTVKSGQVPWMGNLGYDFTSDAKGWVPYCAQYTFINTSIRCWFQNAVWLGIILMILNWLFLLALTFFVGERKADTDYDRYDFKDDVPMAQTSVPGSVNQQVHLFLFLSFFFFKKKKKNYANSKINFYL